MPSRTNGGESGPNCPQLRSLAASCAAASGSLPFSLTGRLLALARRVQQDRDRASPHCARIPADAANCRASGNRVPAPATPRPLSCGHWTSCGQCEGQRHRRKPGFLPHACQVDLRARGSMPLPSRLSVLNPFLAIFLSHCADGGYDGIESAPVRTEHRSQGRCLAFRHAALSGCRNADSSLRPAAVLNSSRSIPSGAMSKHVHRLSPTPSGPGNPTCMPRAMQPPLQAVHPGESRHAASSGRAFGEPTNRSE